MKVLLATMSLDATGTGTAQRTRFLARYLARAGADCQVVTMEDGDLAEGLRAEGVDVYATGFLKLPYHIPFINFRRLDRMVRRAEVLHLLGYWSLLSVFVAWRARSHGRPYFLSVAGEFASLTLQSPVKRVFHRLFGRKMIDGAHALVAITELERQQMVDLLRIDPGKIVVVPNGVEAAGTELQKDQRLPDSPFILFMGKLFEIKGPDLLLEAFANVADRFPDVHLVFAGADFGMLEGLTARRNALNLTDRVHFTGFMDERARQAAYQQMLMLVVPSRNEAMSLVALEAGAEARPVLLTDRCGFDDVQEVGGGRVVPATVQGLSDGLVDLLSHPERLNDMGSRLKAHVLTNCGWPSIADQLLRHLDNARGMQKTT
jgi:glycosyltransferase involved in cell wall biosynthesis